MKKIKKFIATIVTSLVFAIFAFSSVSATNDSARLTLRAQDQIYVGDTVTVQINITNIVTDNNIGINSIGANLAYNDGYLVLQSVSGDSLTYNRANNKFAWVDMTSANSLKTTTNIATLVFQAKQAGIATLRFENIEISNADDVFIATSSNSKNITIIEKGSDSSGSSRRSSGTNSSSANSNSGEDAQPDSESDNSKLASLIVKNGQLDKEFNSDILSYRVVVADDIDELDLSFIAIENDASVEIVGNSGLSGKRDPVVRVVVTASDGSTTTYLLRIELEGANSDTDGTGDTGDDAHEARDAEIKVCEIWGIPCWIFILILILLTFNLIFIYLLFKKRKNEKERKRNKN